MGRRVRAALQQFRINAESAEAIAAKNRSDAEAQQRAQAARNVLNANLDSFNVAEEQKKRGLSRVVARAKNSILNPKIAIKDVGDTARAGLKGSTQDKRANLRAHHEKTIHPLQATAQNITTAERLKSSSNPDEVARGVALRAEADKRSMKRGIQGATVGLAFATGGAVKGAIAAVKTVKQGEPKTNTMPADPVNWKPGDAWADPSRIADTQQQMWAQRPVGAPVRANAGNAGIGGIINSMVNFLWRILVPKRS